jgi:3-phenylpropionate/cinnamic acid dioxygenase small subunit
LPDARAEIENLLYRCAELIDAGDFAGLGTLFAHGAYRAGSGEALRGDAVEAAHRGLVIRDEDGTPRTKHLVHHAQIELEASGDRVSCRSHFTVLQAAPDVPIEVIFLGRYEDRFARAAGSWHFAERRDLVDHVGDVTRHLRTERLPGPLARR